MFTELAMLSIYLDIDISQQAELGPSNQEDGYTLEISILSTGNDRMIFCSEPGQYSLLSWVPDLKKNIFSILQKMRIS